MYGSDGQRSNKFTTSGETLYFNKMWQTTNTYRTVNLRQSKHIYVGDSRLVTKFTLDDGSPNWGHEEEATYWYHSDHLGSAQLVTKKDGTIHERIEYTPYGELWVEATYNDVDKLPFRFTGKEFDEETGLYYYGARYLDPRLSRWISTDPALGEYIPGAPVNEEARKRNGNLPGMGGVYNTINLNLYHYAGNNPMKYTDPDGRETIFMAFYDKSDKKFTTVSINTNTGAVAINQYEARNHVRTDTNGERTSPNVKTMPKTGSPKNYYTKAFPNGRWSLTATSHPNTREYGTSKISTNAEQSVDVYKENPDGTYTADGQQIDLGYAIHGGGFTLDDSNGISPLGNNNIDDNTWGCIRMRNSDVDKLLSDLESARRDPTGCKATITVQE